MTTFTVRYFDTTKNSMMTSDHASLEAAQKKAREVSKSECVAKQTAAVGQFEGDAEDATKVWTYVHGVLAKGNKPASNEETQMDPMTELDNQGAEPQGGQPETREENPTAEEASPTLPKKPRRKATGQEVFAHISKTLGDSDKVRALKATRVAGLYGPKTNRAKLYHAMVENVDKFMTVGELCTVLYGEADKASSMMMVLKALKEDTEAGSLNYELRKQRNGKENSFGLFQTKA